MTTALLGLMAIGFAAGGALVIKISTSAIHEIEALICFVVAAICLAGSCACHEVRRLRSRSS